MNTVAEPPTASAPTWKPSFPSMNTAKMRTEVRFLTSMSIKPLRWCDMQRAATASLISLAHTGSISSKPITTLGQGEKTIHKIWNVRKWWSKIGAQNKSCGHYLRSVSFSLEAVDEDAEWTGQIWNAILQKSTAPMGKSLDALIMSSGRSIRTAFSGMLFPAISLPHGWLPFQTFSQFLHIICATLLSSGRFLVLLIKIKNFHIGA